MNHNYGLLMNMQSYSKNEIKDPEQIDFQASYKNSSLNVNRSNSFQGCINSCFSNNQENSKFNHAYTTKAITPRGETDIKEEISIYGTERNSDLTTDHCSKYKLCHSKSPPQCLQDINALYLSNLPSLSLIECSNSDKDFEMPFKKKISTSSSSVISQPEDINSKFKDEKLACMMNLTFGKEE